MDIQNCNVTGKVKKKVPCDKFIWEIFSQMYFQIINLITQVTSYSCCSITCIVSFKPIIRAIGQEDFYYMILTESLEFVNINLVM